MNYPALQDAVNNLLETQAQELDNQDHAIDLFMEEREALIAENDNAMEIMLQTARYVGHIRTLLGTLGITVETGDQDMPHLVIDRDRFIAAAHVVDNA